VLDKEVLLESCMRQYYFDTDIDIGSSGVQSFSMSDLRMLLSLTQAETDAIVFDDSRTLGDPLLREAIARRWGNGDAGRVMATHGSSEAIYLILNALLRPGDEVVALDPVYPQFHAIAESIGCRLKPWQLSAERNFEADLGELKSLVGPRTRMLIVNFPHNPTGSTLSPEQLRELIEVAAEVGAYLVWDAAFAELTYDSDPLPDPSLTYQRAISIGTLSKAYGLPGLRVGWCIAPAEVLERCAQLRDYINLHLSPLVELIARRAIENADVLRGIRLRQARANLEMLAGWAQEEHGELVEWVRPRGGVCAFVGLRGVSDVEGFCHDLARRHRVLLVPGRCFNYPSHVRLGFGGATAELREGLARLSAQLKSESLELAAAAS
jgi:capreomycidine synthase